MAHPSHNHAWCSGRFTHLYIDPQLLFVLLCRKLFQFPSDCTQHDPGDLANPASLSTIVCDLNEEATVLIAIIIEIYSNYSLGF